MKVLVGMSGGFDSTYSVMKLQREGHTVEGAILIMHEYTDLSSARSNAEKLGIVLHEIDCRALFDKEVRENFVEEYKSGRTPNPCIICNPKVKFFTLADFARNNGFDRIATGHYAKVVRYVDNGVEHLTLARPRDVRKDQTYMLYRLPEDILSMLVLPLADEVKSDLRKEVAQTPLAGIDKPDSQEICFIPDGDYASYIENSGVTSLHGNFIDVSGNVLGEHNGIIRYTVGQRKGLGIPLGKRAFITVIDPVTNNITLDTAPKMSERAELNDVVYTGLTERSTPFTKDVYVKVRYQAPQVPATVTFRPDRTATVEFHAPQHSLTPGQSAVIYDGDTLVAGGFICN